MKCEKAALLAAWVLGDDLGQMDERELEAHVAECPTCKAEAAAYREILGALSGLATPEIGSEGPRRGFERLRETIARYERERAGSRFRGVLSSPAFRRFTQIAAALLFVAVGSALGVLFERSRSPEGRSRSPEAGAAAPPVAADSASARPQGQRFLVLMRSRDQSARPLLRAWGNRLGQEGRLVSGGGAEFGEPLIMGADPRTAPYQLYLDGYMIIHAQDWEEVRRVASQAPNIAQGGGVEIFLLR